MNLTQAELTDHLREAMSFLQASSASFDSGMRAEAKRLAVTIRVLVHDSKSSTSLLQQLGRKASIAYYSTANMLPKGNLLPENRLVFMKMTAGPVGKGGGIEFFPALEDGPFPLTKVSFDAWWNDKVVKDVNGQFITRAQLVLWVSNKDGGAHVDPKLDAQYALLSRGNPLGLTYSDGTDTMTPTGLHLASVRHIAHELQKTLIEQLGDLLG